jgi:hypothetical protein
MKWWTYDQQPKHAWKLLMLSIVVVAGGILSFIGKKAGLAIFL